MTNSIPTRASGLLSATSADKVEKRAKPDPDDAARHARTVAKHKATRIAKLLGRSAASTKHSMGSDALAVPTPKEEHMSAWHRRCRYIAEVGLWPERSLRHDR